MNDLGVIQRFLEQSPGLVVLLVVGLFLFIYLVIDTWRLRRWRSKRRPKWRR